MITDARARTIASEWHGGGGTALYAFVSTGAINTARADHALIEEINEVRDYVCEAVQNENEFYTRQDVRDLNDLLDYVSNKGERGPVTGWYDKWEEN